jgi:hypothetical protein
MNNQIISKSVVIILLMGFLTSCATTPDLSLEDGISVAVEPTTISNINVEVTTKAMANTKRIALGSVGAVGGVALGSMAGFGAGIAACGPLFVICSPAAAIGMGAVGAAAGAVGGSELGGEGITGDKAAQFNQISIHLLSDDIIQMNANDSFYGEVDEHWNIDANSENSLKLEIKSFGLSVHQEDVMQIEVKALLTVATETINDSLIFTYEGPLRSIDYWLQDNGSNISSEMELAMTEVSNSMVTMLRMRNK